jgi:hypothetical protein
MDDRCAIEGQSASRSAWLLPADDRRCRARPRVAGGCDCVCAVALATRTAVCAVVARRAGASAMVEPIANSRTALRDGGTGRAQPSSHRAPHVALLRDLRDTGRKHAAARQLPGRSGAGRRTPHFADQPGALSAVGDCRARFRLGGDDANRRAHRSNVRLDAQARPFQGAFL